ncbi:MAG: inositol monophosphatase [Motiliproteus sp.]|nr:inositol monophosphatase [Motiliproteus sp.]MCW9053183.1 inositol monophosphatase [Motiliproteus sp.]
MSHQLLERVQALVERVGHYQSEQFRQLPPGGGDEKQSREFVSRVDLHSEEMLKEGLQRLLPEAGFYGEESGRSGNQANCWVVDPLDGTTNFLSGLDQFSISVALTDDQGTRLGVVYRPQNRECFRALRGEGLYHNGEQQKRANPRLNLSQALIGTGFPYRSPDVASAFFPCAESVLFKSRGIRRMGSAALDLSYVANGFLQGFWETDLQPYDVAAALLFLQESGCPVSNERGLPYNMHQDRLLICGWPMVHEHLQELVREHYQPLLADPI